MVINNLEKVTEQYQSSENLSIRTNFHEIYSTNKINFFDFLFERYDFKKNSKILEVGCGNAAQWHNHMEYLPDSSTLVLSDFSQSMVSSIDQSIASKSNVKIEVIDINDIPYPNEFFDIVIANHMLYHVPNIDSALKEVSRVLKKDGIFYATTNSDYGIRHYLNQILKEYNPQTTSFNEKYSFSMQNGKKLLNSFFSNIDCIEYKDSLNIPDVAPLMKWIKSISSISSVKSEEIQYLEQYFTKILKNRTGIEIPKEACLFIAKKE